MKTEKQFQTYIESVIKRYAPICGVSHCIFSVKKEPEPDKKAHYSIGHRYPYINQTIYYSKEAFSDWGKGIDQEMYIVHELCHAITDEFYTKSVDRFVTATTIEDAREKLTDHIANIVYKLSKSHS